MSSLADLGRNDAKVVDELATEALKKPGAFAPTDIAAVIAASTKMRLRHFGLLDAFAELAASKSSDFSNADLARVAEGFSELDILPSNQALLNAVDSEASRRAGQLQLGDLLALARALAPCGQEQEPILRTISDATAQLIQDPASVSFEDLCAIMDALPWCRPRLSGDFLMKVNTAIEAIQAMKGIPISESVCGQLRSLSIDNFGVLGTRLILNELRVNGRDKNFVKRAVNRISWGTSQVEDWKLQTSHHRSFAFLEWAMQREASTTENGNALLNDGSHADCKPSPNLKPLLLPHKKGPDPELCVMFRALQELLGVAEAATSPGAGVESTKGSARLYVTDVPNLATLAAVRQVQIFLPLVSLTVAVRGEPEGDY